MDNVIYAKENMWLTQKADVDDNTRIYSQEIWLGKYDSADNYRDADQAEKDAYDERMKPQE